MGRATYLYIVGMNISKHTSKALIWLLGACLASLSSASFSAPNSLASQVKGQGVRCYQVFTQMQTVLYERFSEKLQIDAPEKVVDEYTDALRKTLYYRAIAEKSFGNAVLKLRPLSDDEMSASFDGCYAQFEALAADPSIQILISSEQTRAFDTEIEASISSRMPAPRVTLIESAREYREHIPEQLSAHIKVNRVSASHGRIHFMLALDSQLTTIFTDENTRPKVTDMVCAGFAPHLKPHDFDLITFTLIAPEDRLIGEIEATSCRQNENK